ncbi:MAG: Sip1-related alpha-galactosidase [Planctomycetota bacterium]|jgi:hypothetical protein
MEKNEDAIVLVILLLLFGAGNVCGKWKPAWADYVAAGNKGPITEKVDLAKLPASGVRILENYSGQPNEYGILNRYELVFPEFARGCYFSGDHHPEVAWPDGANRIQPWIFESLSRLCSEDYPRRPSNYPRVREGMFLLLRLSSGRYLALTPIAGPVTMTWLYASADGRMVLNFGTLGIKPVSCDAPLFAWCYSDDIYTACREAWAWAITCRPLAGSTNFRMNKKYPDAFRYLGWCSWEEYKWNISEDILVDATEQIESSGLPIRYVLVDDGHLDRTDKKLRSFFPDANKFPHGWSRLLSMRKQDKVRWIGQWNTVSGYWFTVARDHRLGKLINSNLIPNSWMDALVPANSRASCELFYKTHLGAIKAHGFDFVKVDNQSRNICWYTRGDNAVEAAVNNQLGLEEAVKQYSGGIINCMAHGLPCIFTTKYSAVTRCSIDYKETVWGDHDMFHSSDRYAGRIMAVSKAMSGGPVYLSDNPRDFVAEYIRPLCYEDGELLRPIAPAGPLPDSVFIDPMRERVAYRVIAPLGGGAAAVVAYNLYHPTSDESIQSAVSAEDYSHAGGMMQPYPGRWKVPDEGLVVYDWYAGKAQKLNEKYTFELKGFSDRLLHLCPIRKGWSVIGRTDKYLSPAAVEVLSVCENEFKVRLVESGPFAVWTAAGVPSAKNISFEDKGHGLWKANLKPGRRNMVITLSRAGAE